MEEELRVLKAANSNFAWLKSHYDEMLKEHNKEFIAIHDGRFVTADSTMDGLLAKLNQKGVDVQTTLVKYINNGLTIF